MASFYGCVDGDIHGTDRPVRPTSGICPACGKQVPIRWDGKMMYKAHACTALDRNHQRSVYTDNLAAVDERVVHVASVAVKSMNCRGIRI